MRRSKIRFTILAASAAVLVAALGAPAAVAQETARAKYDPLAEYDARCPAVPRPSLKCEWLRSIVVAEVVETLEALERLKDQRGVKPALSALDLLDEPAILVAACRYLGRFPDSPGVEAKTLPLLLESPYLLVQRTAADLLSRTTARTYGAVGDQWNGNHVGVRAETAYDEIGFPEDYDALKFPEYPGMQRFTPGDSDRTVSWWTSDAPATVVTKLEKALGVKAVAYSDWSTAHAAKMQKAMEIDPAKQAEMEKLAEEFGRTQDMKVLNKLQTLQEEVYAPLKAAGEGFDQSVDVSLMPPIPVDDSYANQLLILEEKGGHVARLILVYRQAALDRTIIQMTWDLRDYPSASGEGDSG